MRRKFEFHVDPTAETEFECLRCRSKIRITEVTIGVIMDDGTMGFYHENCGDEFDHIEGEDIYKLVGKV